MPICTTCTRYIPYLYTEYESAYNLRLEQCPVCHCFADPYVEHDSLTLLLDLILLKRGVYRHLLYNRGTKPRRLTTGAQKTCGVGLRARENGRWILVLRLGAILIFLDAFIRWSYLNPNQPMARSPWTRETFNGFARVFAGCCAETIAFHSGIIVACHVVLHLISGVQNWRYRGTTIPSSDVRREFRFSLIPLTLFYSSLTKLFLLFLLTIWRPTSYSANTLFVDKTYLHNSFFVNALNVFGDDQINREWIIRNVLGGMSAGFGLRVVLDIKPIFTAIIILAGWRIKTSVTTMLSAWVGGDSKSVGEAWRAYSIP